MSFTIRRVRPGEGERFRAIRLRALAESPTAFASTVAETEARPMQYWDDRVRSAMPGRESVLFVAEEDGEWIGLVGGFMVEQAGSPAPFLISMWVDPNHRGQGIGGALVEQVIGWAREIGQDRLFLEVESTNQKAISLYTRWGFRPTGDVWPHPTYPDRQELSMVLSLERSGAEARGESAD